MLLDNPWDESKNREFDIEHFVPSRFNIKEKLPNLNVLVPLPGTIVGLRGINLLFRNYKKMLFLSMQSKFFAQMGNVTS